MGSAGVPGGMSRRHFMQHLAGFSLMAGASSSFVARLLAAAPQMQRDHKSLIILWMSGGPSHMDLWDLKPESSNGGEFKPIKTSAPGIEICEHLPTIAKQMKHLSIVRSLVSNEASHERGRYLMHTAYPMNPAVTYPSMGSMVAYQLTPKTLPLPGFISIRRPAEGPGFLGMAYAPFTVQQPGAPPKNISAPRELGRPDSMEQTLRLKNRYDLLATVENSFVRQRRGEAAIAHREIYKKAFDLVASPLKRVFDLKYETDGKPMSPKTLDEYGDDSFGKGCLLARKLVETGVPCVEIDLGGWDNHNNIFTALHGGRNGQGGLADRLDRGFGALVKDLVQRGLWDNTVVLWLGEFGRTPRINQNGGRDHWARCWSVVLGGGGLKGGVVVGSTDADGTAVKDSPHTVGDLFATVYQGLGIPPDTQVRDPIGRPQNITGDKGGEPIAELI